MNPEEGWVIDQRAIDTVVALSGIQPGDEIQIVNAVGYNISDVFEGKVVVVIEEEGYKVGTPSQSNCAYAGAPVAFHFTGSWVGCRENIGAWRRPKKNES